MRPPPSGVASEQKSSGRSPKRKMGVEIPIAVRWLGRPSDAKARFKEGTAVESSASFVVKGEDVFTRL